VSYVPQALQSGAQLFTGARATRILLRDHRARGVLAEASGPGGRRRLTVRADAVVVSCGSLLTPLLLRRSGLGRRLPALGRHLSLHPAGVVLAEFDEPVRGWEGIPQGFAITQFADDGIVLEGGFPRLEFAATFVQAQGRAFMERMERFDRLAAFGYMIRDESRGRVLAGPAGMPLIRYTLLPSDLRRIHQAIHLLCRVFLAAGARQVHPGLAGVEPISDALGLARLAQLRASTGRLDLAAFHPLGTARLGVDPAVSVTGPDHQVHGVSGLYVVDGSSVPTSLGVNPQLTIMALATRAAEIIAARLAP
jgi:choline dehydrogenase-like flavoprotein